MTTYAYDLAGRPIETVYPNGVVETREYDDLHRLKYLDGRDPSGTVFDSYRYTLDPVGNCTRVEEASGRAVGRFMVSLQHEFRDVRPGV